MLALLIVAAATLAPVTTALAATKTSALTPTNQAKSFAYYAGLSHCMQVGWFKNSTNIGAVAVKNADIGADTAAKWEWFFNRVAVGANPTNVYGPVPPPVIADNSATVGVVNEPEDGDINCSDAGWIQSAAKLWGYTSAPALLCKLGFTREVNPDKCTEIVAGANNNFKAPADPVKALNSLWTSTLGNKSNGVDSIESTGGAYRLYLSSLKTGCSLSPGGSDYSIREYDAGTQTWSTKKYSVADRDKGLDHDVRVYQDKTIKCKDIAALIDSDKDAAVKGYIARVKTNPTATEVPTTVAEGKDCADDASCPVDAAPTCGGTITGIGWIACPVLTALGGLDDAMWTFVSALLTVSPLQQTQINDDGSTSTTLVYQVWQVFRSLANVALIIVFLIIIFSQLSNVAVNNYGVKKLLPRLIIAAIAINVSFPLMQLAVDLANVIGSSLYDLLNGIIKDPTQPTWSGLMTVILGLGVTGGVLAGAIAIAPEAALMILLPGALAAVLGFLAAVLTLMFRQAVIPILAVVAPIAFVAYLLPNTKPWFDKWSNLFISMLVLFPLAAVLFAGVKLSAQLINSGGEWWQTLTALIVLGAPLFALPFLARQSGPMLGKLGGALNGLASRVQKPVGSWAGNRRGAALARSDATPARRGNFGKRIRQNFIRGQRRRDLKTAGYKADSDTAFNNDLVANADTIAQGLGSAGQSHVRAVAARAQAEEVKLAMDSMKLEADFNPNDRAALARTLATALAGNDHTRAAAATNYLVAARGVDELHSTLSEAQGAGYMNADLTTAMQRAMTSSENGSVIKERRPDLTTWGAQGGNISDVSARPGTWNVSAEDAAGLSIGAMTEALASGGLSADIAARVLDTPQLHARLDPQKEAVMQRIAARPADDGGTGGSGAPSSPPIGPVGSEAVTRTSAPPDGPQIRPRGSFVDDQRRQTPTGANDEYHDGMSR